MTRVPEGAAGRELYALLDRDPPSPEEWRLMQLRWQGLFAHPPAPWPYEGPPPTYGLSREESAAIPSA